jgi:hypothetical protein
MTEAPSIFLSYAREDRQSVEAIYDSLRTAGFDPWMDVRSIVPGQEWSSMIGRAIRQADFMLVFISRHSVSKRGFIQREIRAALSVLSEMPEGQIFLIPVRLDESEPPESLRHIQWVDLFDKDSWNKLLTALSKKQASKSEDILKLKRDIQEDDRTQRGDHQPYIFVAMPFRIELEDVYHYAIQGAAQSNGLRSERVDEASFTGDMGHSSPNDSSDAGRGAVKLRCKGAKMPYVSHNP